MCFIAEHMDSVSTILSLFQSYVEWRMQCRKTGMFLLVIASGVLLSQHRSDLSLLPPCNAMKSVLHLQDHLVSECRRSRESVFRGLKSFLELKRSGGKSHAVRNGGLSATATGPGVKGGGGREASKRHV